LMRILVDQFILVRAQQNVHSEIEATSHYIERFLLFLHRIKCFRESVDIRTWLEKTVNLLRVECRTNA